MQRAQICFQVRCCFLLWHLACHTSIDAIRSASGVVSSRNFGGDVSNGIVGGVGRGTWPGEPSSVVRLWSLCLDPDELLQLLPADVQPPAPLLVQQLTSMFRCISEEVGSLLLSFRPPRSDPLCSPPLGKPLLDLIPQLLQASLLAGCSFSPAPMELTSGPDQLLYVLLPPSFPWSSGLLPTDFAKGVSALFENDEKRC